MKRKQVVDVVEAPSNQSPPGEPDDFKAYLVAGAQIDDLEIERDETAAPVIELR